MTEDERTITVTAPATADSIAILRAVAANVAARTEAPIDTVDDLRLAVAEACNRLLIGAPSADSLHMEMITAAGVLETRVMANAPAMGGLERDEASDLSWTIIRGLTDRAEHSIVDDRATITMAVRISPTKP